MTKSHCYYNSKRQKKLQYLQISFLFSSWPTFCCLSKPIFPLPQPLYFSFTWAENRFLQNEIVLDFPTNIAMVSNFKYLQWKHIHMHRPTDRHTDVHRCVRCACTQTERQTDRPNRDAHRYSCIPTNIFRPRRPDVVCYPVWCLISMTPFQAEVKQKHSYNHAHCFPSIPLSCAQGHF